MSDEKVYVQDDTSVSHPASDPNAPSTEVSSKRQSLSDIFTIVGILASTLFYADVCDRCVQDLLSYPMVIRTIS